MGRMVTTAGATDRFGLEIEKGIPQRVSSSVSRVSPGICTRHVPRVDYVCLFQHMISKHGLLCRCCCSGGFPGGPIQQPQRWSTSNSPDTVPARVVPHRSLNHPHHVDKLLRHHIHNLP